MRLPGTQFRIHVVQIRIYTKHRRQKLLYLRKRPSHNATDPILRAMTCFLQPLTNDF